GVALSDPANPHMVIAIFRYRTREGLLVTIPESAELLIPWSAVEAASLDLQAGTVHVTFSKTYVAEQNWLRAARQLTGVWTDRLVLHSDPLVGPSPLRRRPPAGRARPPRPRPPRPA